MKPPTTRPRSQPLERRTVLRGLGGIAISLPWLEAMTGCSSSAGGSPAALGQRSSAIGTPGLTKDGLPKRLIVIASPNGTLSDVWFPAASQVGKKDFALGAIHAPLQAYRDRMVLMKGVDNLAGSRTLTAGVPTGHFSGVASLTTGLPAQGDDEQHLVASGISFDQVVASAIADNPSAPPYKSLSLGSNGGGGLSSLSSTGPNGLLPNITVAKTLFNHLFAVDTSPDAAKIRARRKSILDGALGDGKSLRQRLGSADQLRLDAHLDAIRQIELRLDKSAQCSAHGAPPPGTENDENRKLPEQTSQLFDVLALALGCDMSRVATYMFRHEGATSAYTFGWLGIGPAPSDTNKDGVYGIDSTDDANSTSHHSMSHYDNTPQNIERLTKVNAWFMEMIAGLITRLQAIPEGDGTVFDNSVILYGSPIARGNHSFNDMPFMLMGNAGGAIQTGQYLSLGSTPHNRLLMTLTQAMGVETTGIGDPMYCTQGVLPGLLL